MQAERSAVETAQESKKMPAEKSAVEAAKEMIANIAASAKSGLEKTKAVLEEKVDLISTDDQVEKDMATLRKEDKIRQAELLKQEAYTQNAAAAAGGPESYTAVGTIIVNNESNRTTTPVIESSTGGCEAKPMSSVGGDGTAISDRETKTMSNVAGHGTRTTICPSDQVNEAETGRNPVRTGPEP